MNITVMECIALALYGLVLGFGAFGAAGGCIC